MVSVAKELNISRDTVEFVVHLRNLKVKTSQEINAERKSLAVNCYLKDNNDILYEFKSSREAARFIARKTGVNLSNGMSSHISDVCKGKRKSAYGYVWKYKD